MNNRISKSRRILYLAAITLTIGSAIGGGMSSTKKDEPILEPTKPKSDQKLSVSEAQDEIKAQEALRKYADLCNLPMDERKGVFSNSSPEDRSDFVRIHLALYLAPHAELNEAQKKLILEGLSLATPELYEADGDQRSRILRVQESIRQFSKHIVEAFSIDEGRKLFATMGPPEPDDLLQKYQEVSANPINEQRSAFSKQCLTSGVTLCVRIWLSTLRCTT